MRKHSFDAHDRYDEHDAYDKYAGYENDDEHDDAGSRRPSSRAARQLSEAGAETSRRTRRGRLTELERARLAAAESEARDGLALPEGADRWTTWGHGEAGPEPYPWWLITAQGAVDTDLGVVKTGKEAEVHLVERWLPDGVGVADDVGDGVAGGVTGGEGQGFELASGVAAQRAPRRLLLAEKRYRSAEHRLFHRDAGYLEGRRTRESRLDRAIANRTTFGRKLIGEQWAAAEFAALCSLWTAGAPVPYPVSRLGTDLVLEFIGDTDGGAAPRLAQLRPDLDQLVDLWEQLSDGLLPVARAGFTHGDLSAYNLLVHDGRLVLIDLPQVVDVVRNPRGAELLARDVRNIADWFTARGLPDWAYRTDELLDLLRDEAGIAGARDDER